MSEIKSIWDGWEKQCYGNLFMPGGAECARGFVCRTSNHETYFGEWDRPRVGATYRRVAQYLQEHYDIPAITKCGLSDGMDASAIIVYANNVLKLTPDDFRRIDRETQIAEGMAAAEKLVNEVEAPCLQTR